ncbi:hypothetical protein DL98DRAFT_661559 [Cadophora sp. DSE1049]|nr:hypothetical protein DL98DRAFT_661559 [Cadophora sp. DSE1049]
MNVVREMGDMEPLHPAVKRVRLSDKHIVSPGIIPILGKKHRPPKIPNELWHKIFDLLPVSDIKAVRTSWKLWSAIGARHLFPMFRFSLGRKDFCRFEKISRGGAGPFLKCTKELYIESGKTGVFWISEALALLYHSQHPLQVPTDIQYSNEVAKARTLAEYAEWNVIAHENNNTFRDVHLLKNIVWSFRSLNSIHITRRSPRIDSFILLQAWNLCRYADYFQRAVSEFEALLLALKHSDTGIKHLSHDQLPVTFFRMDIQDMKQLIRPLEGLQNLQFTFDATVPPRKVFWVGLGKFLQSLPHLTDLRFGFFPIYDRYRNGRSWQFCDEATTTWVIGTSRKARFDPGHTGAIKHWITFGGISKHFNIPSRNGCYDPVTSPATKRGMTLQTNTIKPLFRQELMSRSDLTTWEENPKSLISEAVEAFIVRQGPWPIDLSPTAPELDSKGFSADASNRVIISRAWDELPDGKDDIMWELGWEDDVDSHGDEILEYYNSDGYDVHGFNIDGYNQAGVFHTDPSLLGANNPGRISVATTKRRILRRIKDKIPRLDGVRIGV